MSSVPVQPLPYATNEERGLGLVLARWITIIAAVFAVGRLLPYAYFYADYWFDINPSSTPGSFQGRLGVVMQIDNAIFAFASLGVVICCVSINVGRMRSRWPIACSFGALTASVWGGHFMVEADSIIRSGSGVLGNLNYLVTTTLWEAESLLTSAAILMVLLTRSFASALQTNQPRRSV